MSALPQPVEPMVAFAQALRAAGFAIAPDQTVGFIAAVGLLGPGDILDIHKAGLALFAIPPERRAAYDAVFRAVFMDQTVAADAFGEEEDTLQVREPTGGEEDAEAGEDDEEVGETASAVERLSQRQISPEDDSGVLLELVRQAPERLPRRKSYRRQRAKHGDALDVRRTLRETAKFDGDVIRFHTSERKRRQRKVLLLIDVSGSMEQQTEGTLRLAHAVVQAADRVEVFTLGTQLTRITPALRASERSLALARASSLVADVDGGTRLGVALEAFLAIPRYSGFARGSVTLVLSDGLERDAPETLVAAAEKLSRLAWRLDWLTPLAAEPGFRPETAAMAGVARLATLIGDGSSVASIADHILNLARTR